MWDMPFDESMLSLGKNLIIYCPDEIYANKLMEILEINGVSWSEGKKLINNSKWDTYHDTCYWVRSKSLTVGGKSYAELHSDEEYAGYIKCTFYGVEPHDFDVASEDEILSFLLPRKE